MERFCENSKKISIVDVRLGSKYASVLIGIELSDITEANSFILIWPLLSRKCNFKNGLYCFFFCFFCVFMRLHVTQKAFRLPF